MILRDAGFILLVTIIAVGALGLSYSKMKGKDDTIVEEIAEDFIEDRIENLLGLDDDTLDIDLTPGSPETAI